MGARMADQGQGKPTEPRTACYVQVVCFADVRPGDHVWRLGSFREVHAAGEKCSATIGVTVAPPVRRT